jgi:PPP family 3-phenylpropionic acid transporter
MRLWGSVAFVVANLFGGWLVSVGSPLLLVAGLAVSVLSTGVVAICLPGQASRREAEPAGPAKPATVFRSPWFIAVLWIGGLLQATHAAYYGFGTLYWVNAGIDKLFIGALWAIGVVAEIALFYAAKRLNPRFGPLHFLMIAAAGSIVRWTLFPFAEDLVAIVALQALHGISFGAAHLGSVSLLSKVVPQKWAATGQGLLSMSSGLQLALGLAICGPLFKLDPGYPFWAMALAAGIALVALLLLKPLLTAKLQAAERAMSG